MKILNFLICIPIVLILLSCTNGNEIFKEQSFPSGAFDYSGYDQAGEPIVQGWLTLSYESSTKIIGEWHFEKIGDPQGIGPQIGDGDLVGSLNKSEVRIELNPLNDDNNVTLLGNFENSNIKGRWVYRTEPGIINEGTFEAIKRI